MLKKIILKCWQKGYFDTLHKYCLRMLRKQSKGSYQNYLDAGVGSGRFTGKLKEELNVENVLAADIVDYENGFDFVEINFNKSWPIESESLDLITSLNLIEHLDETDTFFEESVRCLQKDGLCLIATNNVSSWQNILALLFGKQPNPCHVSDKHELNRLWQKDSEWSQKYAQHRRIFSLGALARVMEKNGFEILDRRYAVFYPFSGIIERIFMFIFAIYSSYIIVLARKK